LVALNHSEIKHHLGTFIPKDDRGENFLQSLLENALSQELDPLFSLVLSSGLRRHIGSVLLKLFFDIWELVQQQRVHQRVAALISKAIVDELNIGFDLTSL